MSTSASPYEKLQEGVRAPEHNETDLTAEHALKLLFHSFKFSQGNLKLQQSIFAYLKKKNGNWRINEEIEKLLSQKMEAVGRKYTGISAKEQRHSSQTEGENSGVVIDTVSSFKQIMNYSPEEGEPLEKIIAEIADGIVSRDTKWMIEMHGRPRQGDSKEYNPDLDPNLSHFVYYGVLKHPTGVPEYNEMFQDTSRPQKIS